MSGLPPDVGRLRGWWFLFRPYLGWTALLSLCAVWFGVLVALQWDGAGPFFAMLGAAFALWWWLSSRYARAGVAVTGSRQADVHALVRETAGERGLPMPDRIWLDQDTRVIGRVRHGRRELVIGLPVAYVLPRSELTALVAHELSVLATPGSTLAVRLYRRWAAAVERSAYLGGRSCSSQKDAAVQEAFGALGEAIERQADGGLPDAQIAALAVLRLKPIRVDFEFFHTLTLNELTEPVGHRRYAIEDIHDGWRRRVAIRGGYLTGLYVDAEHAVAVGRCHPGLNAAARALVGRPLEVTVPVDAVPVSQLSRWERRLLARMACIDQRWHRRRRWRTFQTAPAEIWRRAATARARRPREAVAKVLGREPADSAEAAEVIRTRPIDVALGWNPDWKAEDIDPDRIRAAFSLDLLEDALLGHGWLRADPAVPDLLRAADGTELDGRELTARAASDSSAYAELLRLLSEA
jgi:hypothetical protein